MLFQPEKEQLEGAVVGTNALLPAVHDVFIVHILQQSAPRPEIILGLFREDTAFIPVVQVCLHPVFQGVQKLVLNQVRHPATGFLQLRQKRQPEHLKNLPVPFLFIVTGEVNKVSLPCLIIFVEQAVDKNHPARLQIRPEQIFLFKLQLPILMEPVGADIVPPEPCAGQEVGHAVKDLLEVHADHITTHVFGKAGGQIVVFFLRAVLSGHAKHNALPVIGPLHLFQHGAKVVFGETIAALHLCDKVSGDQRCSPVEPHPLMSGGLHPHRVKGRLCPADAGIFGSLLCFRTEDELNILPPQRLLLQSAPCGGVFLLMLLDDPNHR